VSGQCGRLKCCLVYEQAAYAELRKGLPKLGKRVYAPRGEGRVVEVDVLRQRVRVSYGPGDTEVLPATDVKPMFPPGNQPQPGQGPNQGQGQGPGRDPGRGPRPGTPPPIADTDDETIDPSEATDDPSALANQSMQPSFVGGAPSPVDIEEGETITPAEPEPPADGIDEALRDVPDDEAIDPE
jgi:hypothetical protein